MDGSVVEQVVEEAAGTLMPVEGISRCCFLMSPDQLRGRAAQRLVEIRKFVEGSLSSASSWRRVYIEWGMSGGLDAGFHIELASGKHVRIEHHDLRWAHDGMVMSLAFDRKAQDRTFKERRASDIKVVQIYSDEWENQRAVCESIIRNALGACTVKLNARDCKLREIDTAAAKEMLQASHISGYTRCSYKVGLFHPEHGLVSVATLRTPIQKKWGDVAELARFSSKLDVVVRGGASKLLSHLIERVRQQGKEGLLSYAELRFGEGEVYAKCGLERQPDTGQGYGYTDGQRRWDRFKFRAQAGMTEKQYALSQNVRAVWGVGNAVYLKKF